MKNTRARALLLIALAMLPLMRARSEALLHTPDGYRAAARGAEGQALLLRQVSELRDGFVVDTSAQATLFAPDGTVLFTATVGGDGDDELRQAAPLEDGWFAVGASSSSDLQNGWHEGWYDEKERKSDGFIARLGANGEVLFTKCIGGSDWDRLRGVCAARGGGFVAVGETFSSDGDVIGWHDSGALFEKADGWVLHLSEQGEILWQLALGGSGHDSLQAVIPVDAGYLAVGFTDSPDGDVSQEERYEPDGWVVLISEGGELLRSVEIGGSDADGLLAVAAGPGGILAGGYSNSDTDWRSGENAWAVYLDEEGSPLWEKRFGSMELDRIQSVIWAPEQKYFAMAGFTQEPGVSETNNWIVSTDERGENFFLIAGKMEAKEASNEGEKNLP